MASRCLRPSADSGYSRVAEAHKYIFGCCYKFAMTPESPDECVSQCAFDGEDEAYDDVDLGVAPPLISDKVALPTDAGTFPVADYVNPELAAYAYA